jgi:hypothetical protein
MRWRHAIGLLATRVTPSAVVALFLTAMPVMGQHGAPINANTCFSALLQNHYDFAQNKDIKYRLFSLWNKELYEDARMSSGMITAYGEGSLDASQTKVLRELQMNNQSIDYNVATAIHVASLDKDAAKIINHCLDDMTAGYGAFSKVEIEDERFLDLTIYWADPSGNPLKIKKQEIFNGIVLDDNKSHPTVPFGSGKSWSDYEIPSGSSRSVRVERTGPYQQVIFNFVVSPNISFEKIVVAPVAEKVEYTKRGKDTDPITGQPLYREWLAQTWVNNNGLVQTSDDGHGHKFYKMTHNVSEITDDPTAVFTQVACEKFGDFNNLDGAVPPWAATAIGQGQFTKDASCSGWWQETGRNMKMKAWAQVTGYETRNITWQPWYPQTTQTSQTK